MKEAFPVWAEAAMREYLMDIRELPGMPSSPRILQYFLATGLRELPSGDETPWCAAGMNFCLMVSGYKGTNSAAARSFAGWGQKTPFVRGAIALLWRVAPSSTTGHVGIALDLDDTHVTLLGGNQSNRWTIQRYPRERLLDLRIATSDMRLS